MSGPIVRKYGFPNFEKIFGERELKHGAPTDSSKPESAPGSAEAPKAEQAGAPPEGGSEPSKNPTA